MSASHEPLVTILTPVYNGARYPKQCVESVLEQTYNNRDYVLVNNYSTDDSLAIAEEYAKRKKEFTSTTIPRSSR